MNTRRKSLSDRVEHSLGIWALLFAFFVGGYIHFFIRWLQASAS